MDGGGGGSSNSNRIESDRPSKSSRQVGPGRFQDLITEFEMVVQPPIFFQSPGSVRDKAEGQTYGNVPIVEEYDREWLLKRFSYQSMVDRDRATPVKLNGTLDTIAQKLAAYTYRGQPLLDDQLFFKVVDALNSVVFGGGGGDGGEAFQALKETTKLFEVAKADTVLSGLQNHEGIVTLPLLFYLHNALSESSNKKTVPGLVEAVWIKAGMTDKDIYKLWYEIYALIKVFSGYPISKLPILQANQVKTYITDLYELDPRPDADPTPFFMAAQDPDAGFGFGSDEDDEDDTEKMQE